MKTRGGPPDTAVTFAVRHGVIPIGSPKHSAHGEDRPMGAYYVGLDVHSRETVFVIQDEAGTTVGRGAVPTTPEGLARVRRDYHLPPGTIVALETGTSAFYVARELAAL